MKTMDNYEVKNRLQFGPISIFITVLTKSRNSISVNGNKFVHHIMWNGRSGGIRSQTGALTGALQEVLSGEKWDEEQIIKGEVQETESQESRNFTENCTMQEGHTRLQNCLLRNEQTSNMVVRDKMYNRQLTRSVWSLSDQWLMMCQIKMRIRHEVQSWVNRSR